MTPLHRAAANAHVEAAKVLCAQKGVDLNAADRDNVTPLGDAAAKGHVDVILFLCAQKGININAADRDGMTPLHHASSLRSQSHRR